MRPYLSFLMDALLFFTFYAFAPHHISAHSLPDYSFSVPIGGGSAALDLNPTGNGCPNCLDWGDGCVHNNTAQGLITQIAALDVQLSTASEAQQPGLQAQKDTLLQQYQNNHAALESFWIPIQQQVLSNADQLLSQTEALSTTTLQGANEKTWQRIYLAKLFRGDLNLTSQQIADLQAVAAQCPLDGGNVVYAARGALEMIQGSPIGWPDNCGDGLQGMEGEREKFVFENGYHAFPNPTQNIITVSFAGTPDVQRTIEIFNLLGTRVILREISPFAGEETIDLNNFSNGVYWLVVREKGRIAFESKITKF